MEQKTYVWNPLHRKHYFKKAGKHPILGMGMLYVEKCDFCGDIEIRLNKDNKKIKVSRL